MNAKVRDVMTTHVVAVRRKATYKDMAIHLREHRVSAFPVVDDENKVIGVVSEADLLTKEALDGEVPGFVGGILRHKELTKAAGLTAADLMTAPAVTVQADDDVAQAARLMYIRRVKRLPVTSPDGHLIGIISRADVLSVYSKPDEVIAKEVAASVMLDSFLVDPARFTITVKDGIVTVTGEPENSSVGHDIIDAVRHLEGVVAVRDRLSYPPDERPASTGPLF
jgi:CBS-domain-containing membrane protein